MSVEILRSKAEIHNAREELRRRKLSFTGSSWIRLARRFGLHNTGVGDEVKSWDVLKTANFLEKNLAKTDAILDIGAFNSELLYILHHLHYSNLSGVDLNPRVKQMAFADVIRYEVSDFMSTPFQSGMFQAITAVSVIEHGFNSDSLLAEISRLLRPSGYFIASFDYWPVKVDTEGVPFFGMEWTIFSEQEVRTFIGEAARYQLFVNGEINLTAQDQLINCANRNYTFAWLVLRKIPSNGESANVAPSILP